jgi:hypothetical protein
MCTQPRTLAAINVSLEESVQNFRWNIPTVAIVDDVREAPHAIPRTRSAPHVTFDTSSPVRVEKTARLQTIIADLQISKRESGCHSYTKHKLRRTACVGAQGVCCSLIAGYLPSRVLRF